MANELNLSVQIALDSVQTDLLRAIDSLHASRVQTSNVQTGWLSSDIRLIRQTMPGALLRLADGRYRRVTFKEVSIRRIGNTAKLRFSHL